VAASLPFPLTAWDGGSTVTALFQAQPTARPEGVPKMPSTKLFVGNIPFATSEADLRELFGRSGGHVTSVRVIMDHETGRSKGYAFVEMSTPQEADKAIQDLNNQSLGGRTIVVAEARPRPGMSGPRGSRAAPA
jgi:RNA recognition motif-containing protein